MSGSTWNLASQFRRWNETLCVRQDSQEYLRAPQTPWHGRDGRATLACELTCFNHVVSVFLPVK